MQKGLFFRLLVPLLCFCTASPAASEEIKLSLDLELREPENIIFNSLTDIATDSKNNIYVLDREEKMVYLFNEDGRFDGYIGKPGQGPGEFGRPCSIYIDTKDMIYVLDESNRRIEVFDSEANYIRSVKIINFPTGQGKRIIVDRHGNFYISGYYRSQNTDSVLSKFSSSGKLIKHFPLPGIEYKGIEFNDFDKLIVMQTQLSGGSMCFDDGERLVFSYRWPHLIKILTQEGDELYQFSKENKLNWIPCVFKTDEINGKLFGPWTHTTKLFFLNNYLVNSIHAVDWEGNPRKIIQISAYKKNPEKFIKIKRIYSVLEFCTKEGAFIASAEIDKKINIKASDRKGRLLAVKVDEEDMQSVVRYNVEITRNN